MSSAVYFHLFAIVVMSFSMLRPAIAADLEQVIRQSQQKVVKIYGAGGLRQMEAYQSGILVSAEGHVLTTLSYVLDTDEITVVLDDGRRLQASLLGSDPLTELAVLELKTTIPAVHYFDLRESNSGEVVIGQRVLALSNLYGIATGNEPVSVLHGVITAIAPLQARRGAYQSNYRGEVFVLDAYANNPGATGGALVDWQGQLMGVLGKELRSEVTGTWLNYALPVDRIAKTVEDIVAGRLVTSTTSTPPAQPHTAEKLGIRLVANVLPRTPPYIDGVRRNSAAAKAGLRVDDLIVFVSGEPIDSHKTFKQVLSSIEDNETVSMSVLRAGDLKDLEIQTVENSNPDSFAPTVEGEDTP